MAMRRGAGWLGAMLLLAAPAAAESKLPPPVNPACISSPFGPRRLVGPHAATFHTGIDFPAPPGTWVRAVLPGRVAEIRRLGSEGPCCTAIRVRAGSSPAMRISAR
jgi:murein DD-endopeptidase MepM/ murein hydrolase activator NlpD